MPIPNSDLPAVAQYMVEVVRGLAWELRPCQFRQVSEEIGNVIYAWNPAHGDEPTVAEIMAHEPDWQAWQTAQALLPTGALRRDLVGAATKGRLQAAKAAGDHAAWLQALTDIVVGKGVV